MDEDTPEKPLVIDGRQPLPLRWIAIAEQVVGMLLLVAIFLLVLTQAAQRYLPVEGWVWTGELSRFCLVALTFVMAGYLMSRGEQITIEVIDNYVSPRVLRVVKIVAALIIAAFSFGFVFEGINLVAAETGTVSTAMGMPLTWLYITPTIGFLLMGIRAIASLFLPDPKDGTSSSVESLKG